MEQETSQRSYGQGKTTEPACGMVGLRALVALAGIDDQCARQHHLCQAEDSSQAQTQEQQQPETSILTTNLIDIMEHSDQGGHRQDSPHADDISTVVLDEERHEDAKGEEANAEGAHGDARLHG